MDRNTILAIVLSTIVIIVATTLQAMVFNPQMEAEGAPVETVEGLPTEDGVVPGAALASTAYGQDFIEVGPEPSPETFTFSNEVATYTFDPKGGTVSSVLLNEYKDAHGGTSELIFKDPEDPNPFMLYAGSDKTNPIDALFSYTIKEMPERQITQIMFERDFQDIETGTVFTIRKIYAVPMNDEYMIQLVIEMDTENGDSIPLNFNGDAYTLAFGPQVGPGFEKMNNYDWRRVSYNRSDKGGKKNAGFKNGLFTYTYEKPEKSIDWMALSGKYFTAIGCQETPGIIREYSASHIMPETGVSQENSFYFTRKATAESSTMDLYSYYLGPEVASELAKYDRAQDNVFGLEDHGLKKVLDSSWLSWLETALSWCLGILYKVIPNYGVGIIIMTFLIKLLLHPLTQKGMESNAKMAALQPKIDAIKEKFPDDPEKQNNAMAKLYKEESINPMSSCWPMLIQFPLLIAFYGLLNKNIALRGAVFIPGWISDLSIPETIFSLPFNLPFLGRDVHLLPILYTASMIFSMKITQTGTGAGQGAGMMKFMTYGMPIIFFFIMYNAPSGLLLYWSVMNVISIVSQIIVNKKKGAKFALEVADKDAAKAAAKKNKRK